MSNTLTYENKDSPTISVIIPVHNTESFLNECLDSVINQTLTNIEIICINDGSTDNSLKILEEYADRDNRIKIISQENKGGGAARNAGLVIAKGEYLAFLDSDDFFNTQALQKAYAKIVADNADIVVFNCKVYYNSSKRYVNAPWVFMKKYFPKAIPFSYHDVPDYILNMFSSTVWNKLYKKEMIKQYDIIFQESMRTNDLYFSYLALIHAKCITTLDEALVYYRKDVSNSSQSTNHETPLDFYFALISVKKELDRLNIFYEVKRSYINRLLGSSIYILMSIKRGDVFEYLYNKLKDDIFPEIDLGNYSKDYFHDICQNQYIEAKKIMSLSAAEYLFDLRNIARADAERYRAECDESKKIYDGLKSEYDRLNAERNSIIVSYSYRLGRLLTWFPRKVRDFFLRTH